MDLARPHQVALRLLERDTRLALRNPNRDLYHAHHPEGSPWAILLAPRSAAQRLYLSRADRRRFYQAQSAIAAPAAAPGSLLASWPNSDHPFTHVTSDAQAHIVLFASTAEHHIHIPLDAPATALAIPFAPKDSTHEEKAATLR